MCNRVNEPDDLLACLDDNVDTLSGFVECPSGAASDRRQQTDEFFQNFSDFAPCRHPLDFLAIKWVAGRERKLTNECQADEWTAILVEGIRDESRGSHRERSYKNESACASKWHQVSRVNAITAISQ